MKKRTIRLKWLLVGVCAIALVLAGWRTWQDWNEPAQYWRRVLRWGDADRRREAVGMLAKLEGRKAVPDLMRVLEGPDDEVRVLAVRKVSEILVPEWAWPNPEGVPAEVIAAMKGHAEGDHSPAVRVATLEALAHMASRDRKISRLLYAKARDVGEAGEVRAAAFSGAGKEWRSLEEVIDFCADPAPEVRRAAFQRLGGTLSSEIPSGEPPPDAYVDACARGLSDPDRLVRFAALRAVDDLRGRHPSRSIEPLRRLVPGIIGILEGGFPAGEDRRDLCCRPLRAIAVVAGQAPEAIRALEARLGDEDPEVRLAAARSLAVFGAEAMPALPSLMAANPEARRADPALDRKYAGWIGSILSSWLAARTPTR